MDIKFPIFLKDRDGWMCMIKTAVGLDHLEKIDIEQHEYVGWDFDARPIEIILTNDSIAVRLSKQGTAGIPAIRQSILDYARTAGPKDIAFNGDGIEDLIRLFEAAEKHASQTDWLYRFKSIFTKVSPK